MAPDRIRRLGLTVVPEGHRVLGTLTVRENFEVAALQHSARTARSTLESAISLFPELEPLLAIQAANLSGGQKQMVAIA